MAILMTRRFELAGVAVVVRWLRRSDSLCSPMRRTPSRTASRARGPADFKFSAGYSQRALLEVKKLHNGKFWNGLEKQLISYMKSDKCSVGRFLAVQYREHNPKTEVGRRRSSVIGATKLLGDKLDLNLASTVVDARKPLSASKL